jgi:hypothetical protein
LGVGYRNNVSKGKIHCVCVVEGEVGGGSREATKGMDGVATLGEGRRRRKMSTMEREGRVEEGWVFLEALSGRNGCKKVGKRQAGVDYDIFCLGSRNRCDTRWRLSKQRWPTKSK